MTHDHDDVVPGPTVTSPVIRLTPGRCSSCSRFVSADTEPTVWAVEVPDEHQQVPGLPNIWARTRCDQCRYVKPGRNKGWAWSLPMTAAVERAEMLGQEVPEMATEGTQ